MFLFGVPNGEEELRAPGTGSETTPSNERDNDAKNAFNGNDAKKMRSRSKKHVRKKGRPTGMIAK